MKKIKKFFLENTSTKQTAIKNTVWLFAGEIIGRLLKLAIVVFATRKLGVEGWGVFSYSLSFIAFFYFLGDFGVNTFLTREMSKDNENKHKYLSTAVIVKVVLLGVFFLISLIVGPNLGNIKLSFVTVLVFSTFFVSESLREFAMSINRSLQKMEKEGFSKILINLIITIVGVVLIMRHNVPLSLALAYMIGSIVATAYIFWSLKDEFKHVTWKFSQKDFKTIFDFSWPLIILGFFTFIFSIDSIMLGQMKSATDVGLYAAAQRLVQFTSIIPGFIAIAIFPILSKRESDSKTSAHIFEKIMVFVLALAIPLVIGGIFLSTEIVHIVLGPQYVAAGPVLMILMVTILAVFPDMMLNNLIYSKNLQKVFLKTTSFGLAVNLILNFWLIPQYGAIGAALSTTAAQLLIMTLNWNRLKKFMSFSVMPKLGKIVIANIVIAVLLLGCNSLHVHFVLTVALAVIVYVVLLKLLKEPTLEVIVEMIR